MKKKTNIIVVILSIIGLICTAICLCYFFRDRIKSSALFQKFFGDDDLELDFFDDEFMEDEDDIAIPGKEENTIIEEEAEAPTPKVRRGYIPLKFTVDQTA